MSPLKVPSTILDDWRAQCRLLAEFLGAPVALWRLDGAAGTDRRVASALRPRCAGFPQGNAT